MNSKNRIYMDLAEMDFFFAHELRLSVELWMSVTRVYEMNKVRYQDITPSFFVKCNWLVDSSFDNKGAAKIYLF